MFGWGSSKKEEEEIALPKIFVDDEKLNENNDLNNDLNNELKGLIPEDDVAENASWLSYLKPKGKLVNPGKYDEMSRETKNTTSTHEIFDGIKIDVQKATTNSISSSHSLSFGSTDDPPSYCFAPAYQHEGNILWGRIDTDGTLQGRWIYENSKISGNVGGQAVNQPHQSAVSAEITYKGEDYTGHLKWVNTGIFGMSYCQSITPSLALGCDFQYVHKQGFTVPSFGGKFTTKNTVSSIVMAAGSMNFSYAQSVGSNTKVAAEWTLQPGQYGMESVCAAATDFMFHQSHYKARIDSNLKIHTILEEILNNGSKVAICATVDHLKKEYKFGFGLTFNF